MYPPARYISNPPSDEGLATRRGKALPTAGFIRSYFGGSETVGHQVLDSVSSAMLDVGTGSEALDEVFNARLDRGSGCEAWHGTGRPSAGNITAQAVVVLAQAHGYLTWRLQGWC